jgi:serine/threonine-protein kinase
VLGGYRLCLEIGTGGMATVFLAHGLARSGAHRFAAVKCIRPELALDPRFVEMFRQEAWIATQIHHANVCNVLELDEHHGTYYIAMELLAGQTVTAIQRAFACFPTESIGLDIRVGLFARVFEAACEGLHAAHEAADANGQPLDVVHRDVSPDNLFVTYDGNVKVMDFGVAYTSGHHAHTRTGVLKGKCSYLAPEVLAGNKPDRRADVWGLGVVAWETIARRKLFDQPTDAAILRAIAEEPIPPPSSLCPGLPPAFDAIIMRALERDPDRRYATARDLGRALNRFVVEQGWVVGSAEIADFMAALFPEERAVSRQQLKFAAQLEPPPQPRARTVTQKREPAPEPTIAEPKPTSTAMRVPPRRSMLLVMAALIGIVVATSAVVVACRGSGEQAVVPAVRPTNFTLEATPAGVDDTGAVLVRIRVVPKT